MSEAPSVSEAISVREALPVGEAVVADSCGAQAWTQMLSCATPFFSKASMR